uniref:Uncharacterized protein n=1 Tax=viral metagenome TaxID=1070528 RepID=A0A6M3LH63_9ZZZZ
MANLTLKDLERRIASLELKLINAGLWYCKTVDCIYCKKETIQKEVMLEKSEPALLCLNCGKIWHKDQKIVEYTKKI